MGIQDEVSKVVEGINSVEADYIGDKMIIQFDDRQTLDESYDLICSWWHRGNACVQPEVDHEGKRRRRARFQELLEEFRDEL